MQILQENIKKAPPQRILWINETFRARLGAKDPKQQVLENIENLGKIKPLEFPDAVILNKSNQEHYSNKILNNRDILKLILNKLGYWELAALAHTCKALYKRIRENPQLNRKYLRAEIRVAFQRDPYRYRFFPKTKSKRNPQNESHFKKIISACGGKDKIKTLPFLDLKENIGKSEYIDFIKPEDMISSIMRFQDRLGRRGFAVRARANNGNDYYVQAFFERRINEPTWVSAGDRLINFFPHLENSSDLKGCGQGCFINRGVIEKQKFDEVISLLKSLIKP